MLEARMHSDIIINEVDKASDRRLAQAGVIDGNVVLVSPTNKKVFRILPKVQVPMLCKVSAAIFENGYCGFW